jgi:hypothetical protein
MSDGSQTTAAATIDVATRDGITIGLIDGMITIANALNERLMREGRRMKRRSDWKWFSDDVQAALADLAHNKAILQLIRPDDETAMDILHRAAELIGTKDQAQ